MTRYKSIKSKKFEPLEKCNLHFVSLFMPSLKFVNQYIRFIINTLSVLLLFCSCQELENKKHKVIRYNQGDEHLTSLDPAFARSKANIRAITQLFNGLVELDKNLKVVPCIAKNWEVSANGLEYTFHLEDNIYFHDHAVFPNGKGRKLSAYDVVYSFKRIIDTNIASPGAWVFNDKLLKNSQDKISDTCFVAKDSLTVKIYLQKPFPAFLEILAMPYCFIVPKEAIALYGKDFRVHPIGTGAFQFKQWDEGSTLIFLKNPHYWRKDSLGNPLPYLDAIQISFINDKTLAFLTFSQGKLDFLTGGIEDNSPELFLEQDGSLKEEFKETFRFDKRPYLFTEYLGFQLDTAFYKDKSHPFLNKKVRQALSYALNRDELISFLRFNLGVKAASGMVPTAIPYFEQHKVNGYDYDPQKAIKLLKEAGFGHPSDLPEIKLYTSAPYRYIAEHLQKQWSDVGIKVKLEINQASTHREMIDKGIAHFFRASWLGDYPDAENYLSLFYSKNFTPTGPNKCHYTNPIFDKLYETAIKEPDAEKRNAMYWQLDQQVMDDAPVIVLFYDQIVNLIQSHVKGLDVNAMNTLSLEKVNLDQ
jgi:ABC-type transport system substrate-binding protein